MSRLISFAVLIAIIILIGLLFYKVLIGFFIPVFLSAVLVVVFRPLHKWVLEKSGHRDQIAAFITTILICLTLIMPVALVAFAAANQGLRVVRENDFATLKLRYEKVRNSLGLNKPVYYENLAIVEKEIEGIIALSSAALLTEEVPELTKLADQTVETLGELQTEVEAIEGEGKYDAQFEELNTILALVGRPNDSEENFMIQPVVQAKSRYARLKTQLMGGGFLAVVRERADPSAEELEEIRNQAVAYLQPRLLSISGATGTFLVKFFFGASIMIVATFFFLYDGPSMVKSIMRLSPLEDSYEEELLLEFDRISRAVVLATLLSAVVQGITAGIGYFFVGMDFLILLIMLTTIFAMVPFVGPAVVWVPVCLYVGVYEERMMAAVLLAVWGILVVGTVDNLVKAVVLHGQSQLHPFLALLSVLGGVQTLGPVGIVVGPMAVALLQTLLGILQRELQNFDKMAAKRGGNEDDPNSALEMLGEELANAQTPEPEEADTSPTAESAARTESAPGSDEQAEKDNSASSGDS